MIHFIFLLLELDVTFGGEKRLIPSATVLDFGKNFMNTTIVLNGPQTRGILRAFHAFVSRSLSSTVVRNPKSTEENYP